MKMKKKWSIFIILYQPYKELVKGYNKINMKIVFNWEVSQKIL